MGRIAGRGRGLSFLGVSILVLSLFGCASLPKELTWYRGNTHAHSNKSDGNETPDAVAAWYLNRGYNFLCITDHNMLTAPGSVRLPVGVQRRFILIPSEEIRAKVHATAMNINRDIIVPYGPETFSGSIQKCKEETEKAAGILILNHPFFEWQLSANDLRAVDGLSLFELYNGGSGRYNEGDGRHPSAEAVWDTLLTDGMLIYGVASDDAHYYPTLPYSPVLSGPGKGWVMVHAERLTSRSICSALLSGRFYATIGVLLSRLEISPDRIVVEIDKAATESELAKGTAFGRPAPHGSFVGERIDFIGTGGKLLGSFGGLAAEYAPNGKGYVRARAVVTRDIKGQLVEFCAWSQPIVLR